MAAGLAFAGLAAAEELEAQAPAQSGEVETLSAEDMDALAGGTGFVITNQNLNAYNSGNTVIGDVVGSGQVNLGSGAFSGYSGIGNFAINTGHNNNLQSTVSVSVLLAPPEGQ